MTGDRDMYQCAASDTTVLFLKQGSSGFETSIRPRSRRRYGIQPALVPDFIALRGDPSDGLPGAPGIGAEDGGRAPVRATARSRRRSRRRRPAGCALGSPAL